MKTKMKSQKKRKKSNVFTVVLKEKIVIEHIMMKMRTTLQAKKQLERGILRCEGAISTLEVLLKELKA